ncbi:MAG TPA: hypothetical protein VIM89_02165 [Mucilaginibacter sp.]
MIPIRVIEYHAVKRGITFEESQTIFCRLEAFLNNASESLKSVPTVEVDEAWHVFILHTRQYHEYCIESFGRFIHHNPYPVKLSDTCDTGGQQRANCDKEEEKCEAGFIKNLFADCDDGDNGRCDAQLNEILTINNQHV